jgi:glycosyltransferase involved in cell wall biosynthesis
MKDSWIKRAAARDVGDRFHFVGEVDYEEVPVWLGAMDVCVAPFLRSAGLRSPVKLFDYMACGRPVVASKIEGTTDIFERCSGMILIPPEDTGVLSENILALLEAPKRSEKMGAEGRAFVAAMYDRASFARRIIAEAGACLLPGMHRDRFKRP